MSETALLHEVNDLAGSVGGGWICLALFIYYAAKVAITWIQAKYNTRRKTDE